ncbi:MAG: urate hydroxylase PuuD, partial [Rhodoferax sp.]
ASQEAMQTSTSTRAPTMASPRLPAHLHWFYWESYSTWLSGFSLFTVSYLWSASTYLIDKSKMDWSPTDAIGVALSFLLVFWFLYDGICRLFGQKKNGDAIVGALVLVLVCIASWLACHWFAGRAAFLLVGAMLATTMSASVFFWIIPGQKKVIESIKAGQPVDPIHGMRGKQRSVHNTYFTLPVLFAMLSGHYSFTYTHPQNWLVLVLMMFAGAAIRQFFVMRHGFKLGRNANPMPYALVGVAVIVGVIVWLRPAPPATPSVGTNATTSVAENVISTKEKPASDYAAMRQVLTERCILCHGAQVQMKNVRLDSPDQIKLHAQNIYQQAVVTKVMPMNNSTGITDEERQTIKKWFEAGARTD